MKSRIKQSKSKPDKKSKQKSKEKQKSITSKSRISTKKKLDHPTFPQQFLNQNIIINKKHTQPNTTLVYSRQIFSAMNYTQQRTQSRNIKKRPGTSIGIIRKSIKIKNIPKIDIDMDKLVTQQDIIITQDNKQRSQILSQFKIIEYKTLQMTQVKAAILIQKMWRGYQTRKIIKFYLELYHHKAQQYKLIKQNQNIKIQQKQHQPQKQDLNKTQKVKKTKKLSDIVNLNEQRISDSKIEYIQSVITKNRIQKKQFQHEIDSLSSISQNKQLKTQINQALPIQESLNRLKQQQLEKWNEIINLIHQIPRQDLHNNNLLVQLIKKSQQNKIRLQQLNQPIILTPSKEVHSCRVQKPITSIVIVNTKNKQQSINFEESEHPLLKIFEIRLKMMKGRQKLQLSKLQKKFIDTKITKQEYQFKKQRIINKYLRERKQINQNKIQICFGLEKAHQAIINSKKDAEYLHKITGKTLMTRHSLSSETLFESFVKDQIVIDSTPSITPCSSIQSIHLLKRTSTQLQSPASYASEIIQSNNTKTNQNQIEQDSKMTQLKKDSAQKIQQNLQNKLIQQICLQILLSDPLYKVFQPLIDIHNVYNFQKVEDYDIENFLNQICINFLPSEQNLLSRLNQKINPTPRELLKILRNQEIQCDQDNEFYELVISQDCFKKYRQWRQSFIPNEIESTQQTALLDKYTSHQKEKLKERFTNIYQRKKKLLKFQKDLQAMYLKSVFNCFNQSIIQIKSSYSTLNGRSTIGPGQLRVSMIDSNIKVRKQQIKAIISKAKKLVLQNVRYKCPILVASNYSNVFKFQENLTKQISYQFNRTQFKWVSIFDQILELSMDLTRIIQNILFQQALSQIFGSRM